MTVGRISVGKGSWRGFPARAGKWPGRGAGGREVFWVSRAMGSEPGWRALGSLPQVPLWSG